MSEFPVYREVFDRLSLREKAGQLFMPAAYINDTEKAIKALESLIESGQVGGLCFFHSPASAATNFEGKKEIPYNALSLERLNMLIERYQKVARYPLLMAIDAEWGLAMRVERAAQYPYAITLGALNPASEHLLYDLGLRMAQDCREIGIHLNLAPVVDVNTNPENPVIGYRAFGNCPEDVSRKAVLLHRGMINGGLLSCAKHFPGHGDTAIDSHLNLPVLDKNLTDLEREELIPFREMIRAKVPVIMTGHLSLPRLDPSGLPASLSRPIIRLLREMNFEGAIITDALNMHALHGIESEAEDLNLKALEAGNDILCYADRIPESIDRMVSEGAQSRIEESFKRVWELKTRAFNASREPLHPTFTMEDLNHKLIQNCICDLNSTRAVLPKFRDTGFTLLTVGQTPDVFIHALRETFDFTTHQCPSGVGIQEILPAETRNILLTLQPPSMKPKDFFGLPTTLIEELTVLGAKYRTVLYHFGNPYLLARLPNHNFTGIVCAFQGQPVFQEVAANHFLGKFAAPGILPIALNHDE